VATSAIKSILIIRLSAIGDIVMSTLILEPLTAKYPEAKLCWLVQPEAADLLTENKLLDEVIVLPRKKWRQLYQEGKWLTLAREIGRFRKLLRSKKYDMVIDAQGLLKSGILARFSGAKKRIGLGSREGSHFLMTKVIERPANDKRIGSEYRCLIRALGMDESKCRMRVSIASDDEEFARRLVNEHSLARSYAVVCPFTTRPQKHWFDKNWNIVINRVDRELGMPVIILGGPGDREAARVLVDSNDNNVTNMTGKTRLRQAAALIKNAKLLIGVDTGLTHMGTAFEIPTIALFGSTCPYLETDSNKTRVIYRNLECSPCRRKPTCDGDYTCMKLITADEVIDTARELLPKA